MTKRNKRIGALVALCVAAASTIGIAGCTETTPQEQPQETASEAPRGIPLDYSGFDPENIMSDAVLDDSRAMNDEQIAAFINEKGEGCRAGRVNDQDVPCLKDFKAVTETFPAMSIANGDTRAAKRKTLRKLLVSRHVHVE